MFFLFSWTENVGHEYYFQTAGNLIHFTSTVSQLSTSCCRGNG